MRSFFRKSALLAVPSSLLVGTAFAADESGITTTQAVAVITDGQAKGLVIGLAMLGLVIAFKILKKVRSAA